VWGEIASNPTQLKKEYFEMRFALVVFGVDSRWYVYGLFPTYGHASKYATKNFAHLSDDNWHIAQYLQVE